jgi:tRNA A58 N-methylase Trm61
VHHVALAGTEYANFIAGLGEKFDVISVDGRQRVSCVGRAVQYLREGGVLVFDNSYREKYRPALLALQELGFRRLDFVSLAPMCGVISETSIFYRDGNCLGL